MRIRSSDEIEVLADSFNSMVDELAKHRDHLEVLVAERTSQLEQVQSELPEASRRAGMAELATGVHHNIGNILSSVNVRVEVLVELFRGARLSNLTKVADLLHGSSDLLTPLLAAPKGQLFVDHVTELARHQTDQEGAIESEIADVCSSIDAVQEIVALQQSHAGAPGVREFVDVAELIDGALRMERERFEQLGIEVHATHKGVDKTWLERAKVLQIVMNLVSNAIHALQASGIGHGQLFVGTARNGPDLVIEVRDDGLGIPPENIDRIFNHGFTTKKEGHSFGLHYCANAAAEMRGSLRVISEGTGHGACFRLKLPIQGARSDAA
ncbi:MAG: ATP-binding protein [Nannocystaceae bacterium]